MLPAIISGIVIWDAPVSYWSSFSPVPSNSPRSLAKVNSAQVPSHFKVANEYRNVILPSKHRQRSFHGSKLFKM